MQCVYEFWLRTIKGLHTPHLEEKWIGKGQARVALDGLKIASQLYAKKKHCADKRVKLNEFRNPFRRNLLVPLLNKINYSLYTGCGEGLVVYIRECLV